MAKSKNKLNINTKELSSLSVEIAIDGVDYDVKLDTSMAVRQEFLTFAKQGEKLQKAVNSFEDGTKDVAYIEQTFLEVKELYVTTLKLLTINKDVIDQILDVIGNDIMILSKIYEHLVTEYNKHNNKEVKKVQQKQNKGKGRK